MAKLTVYDAIFAPREVEVPDECPDCGAGMFIGDGNNLVEWDWSDCQIHGGLLHNGPAPEDIVFEGDGENKAGDAYHPAALICSCGHVFGEGGSYVFPDKAIVTGPTLEQALRECRDGEEG